MFSKKFKKWKVVKKLAKFSSGYRVTAVRHMQIWFQFFPWGEHAVRTFNHAFHNCVSRGRPAIIEGIQI